MNSGCALNREAGYFTLGLFKERNIRAIFSIKPASYKSVSSPRDEGVIKNRKRLCRLLGLDFKRLIHLNQVHDCNIYVAKNLKTIKPTERGFDAVITAEKKLPLAIFTADCLPIFFSDTNNAVIALAHAGWRGTHKKISQKVISRLKGEFNINPEDLIVGLGPSLRGCCYEVTGEFFRLFPDSITKKGKRYYLDLIKENIGQLVESGVRKDNIFDSRFCTFCSNELFFSYRREGKDCGRTISLIALA
jgi:YfiH family protein